MRQSPYNQKSKNQSFVMGLLLPGLWRVIWLYVMLAAVMFSLQRGLMYRPAETMPAPEEAGVEMEAISLTTPDQVQLTAWYHPARGTLPTIVYFQGNAGSLATRDEEFRAFSAEGFGVLALSYRGFAGSHGHPSETGLYTDARTAMAWLHGKGVHAANTIIYGESLGTGVATQMALEYPVKALVLEAPFTSTYAVARDKYWYLPVEYMLMDRYDTLAKIPFVKVPVLVLHGEQDHTVPFALGKQVFDAAMEPKKFVSFPDNDHNNKNVDEITGIVAEFVGLPRSAPVVAEPAKTEAPVAAESAPAEAPKPAEDVKKPEEKPAVKETKKKPVVSEKKEDSASESGEESPVNLSTPPSELPSGE